MIIPWIAVGPNIKKGYTIQSEITLLDTAPTVAKILGIEVPPESEGRSADEIFQ
jgi:arylsulfatase A-like enzyme